MSLKLPRYSRLLEMENSIDEILEYYGQTKTVFDIKRMRKSLGIGQFAIETFVNLHVMTSV